MLKLEELITVVDKPASGVLQVVTGDVFRVIIENRNREKSRSNDYFLAVSGTFTISAGSCSETMVVISKKITRSETKNQYKAFDKFERKVRLSKSIPIEAKYIVEVLDKSPGEIWGNGGIAETKVRERLWK